MGPQCLTCAHPKVLEIDAAINSGRSIAQISKTIGLSYNSLKRHRNAGHVAPAVPSNSRPASSPTSSQPKPADGVRSLQELLEQLDQTDVGRMSPRERISIQELRRKTADSLARAQPPVDSEGPAQRKLEALEEMVRVQDEVMERFPEARQALSEALVEWRSRRRAADAAPPA